MGIMDIWKNHCLKTDDIDEVKNVPLDIKNRCLKLNY